MVTSRYNNSSILDGKYYETLDNYRFLYDMVWDGRIKSKTIQTVMDQRLDHIAFDYYGDGRYWWVLAIVNGIGFMPQIRPGTELRIPSINDILGYF